MCWTRVSFTQGRMLQADSPTGTKWLDKVLRGEEEGPGRTRKGDVSSISSQTFTSVHRWAITLSLGHQTFVVSGCLQAQILPHTPGLVSCQHLSLEKPEVSVCPLHSMPGGRCSLPPYPPFLCL